MTHPLVSNHKIAILRIEAGESSDVFGVRQLSFPSQSVTEGQIARDLILVLCISSPPRASRMGYGDGHGVFRTGRQAQQKVRVWNAGEAAAKRVGSVNVTAVIER